MNLKTVKFFYFLDYINSKCASASLSVYAAMLCRRRRCCCCSLFIFSIVFVYGKETCRMNTYTQTRLGKTIFNKISIARYTFMDELRNYVVEHRLVI